MTVLLTTIATLIAARLAPAQVDKLQDGMLKTVLRVVFGGGGPGAVNK